MKRTPIPLEWDTIPEPFHPFLSGAAVFDSSCSSNARVLYLEKDGGFYLKSAPKGALRREADMTRFFHSKGLGTQVLAYESLESDWILTRRIPGEDCCDPQYLADPTRLCDTLGECLRMLHDSDPTGCPILNHTAEYIEKARRNFLANDYNTEHFPDNWGYRSPEDAWKVVEGSSKYLKTDTLLHGDYCLPNIMLDNWRFSGFIDLDTGGVGDRHVDLFWGIWSLSFNLKTSQYRDRFLDAYGRDRVCEDIFSVIAALEVFTA